MGICYTGYSYFNGGNIAVITQRIKNNITIGLLLLAMAVVPLVSLQQVAVAVDNKSNTNVANTLSVTPVRSDVEIPAGTSKTIQVTVTNTSEDTVVVTPIENDFIAKGEDGKPSLILDADQYAPTHSLKRYTKPLTNVTLTPGKATVVDVVVTMPKDARAGGYFGAIRFIPAATEDGGQVNMSGSVASLMLVTVPGNFKEKLTLTEFNVQQNGKSGKYFQNPNNLTASFRFVNDGDVQNAPFGNISVKKGDKVVYSYQFNEEAPRSVVLPDSARRWDVPLKNIGTFGHYTVEATLTYGKANKTVNVTQDFWVVPLVMIIGGIVGILVLIGVIVAIVAFLRSYKKRIINSYGRGGRRH